MVSVLIEQPWIAPQGELHRALPLMYDEDGNRGFDRAGITGEVRRLANGGRRAVSRAGRNSTAGASFSVLPAELQQLEQWAGRVMLYRDGLGNRLWCVYFGAPWTPTLDGRRRIVQLNLQGVTVQEAV